MKHDRLKTMSILEIEEEIRKSKEELFKLRFRTLGNQLDNPLRIRTVRRQIARLLTLHADKRQTAAAQ